MDILKRKPEGPTPKELARIDGEENIRTQEALQDFDPTQLVKLRDFSDKVLEDGMWQVFFEPFIYNPTTGEKEPNPYYSKAYAPLYLFFGRACRLGKMGENEIRRWKHKVHMAAQRCYTLSDERQEHYTIKSMEDYLQTVVPTHSFDGFFLKTLFEQKKTLDILSRGAEKKKGWRLW